jgi:hypothetical protein
MACITSYGENGSFAVFRAKRHMSSPAEKIEKMPEKGRVKYV